MNNKRHGPRPDFSSRLAVLSALIHITAASQDSCPSGTCPCWAWVGRSAATNNGQGCTVQLKATEETASEESSLLTEQVSEYPKVIFCDDTFEQGCDTLSCVSYAGLLTPPCSENKIDGCWVPYLVTGPDTCVPWKCSQFGVFTEGGKYENGGYTRATFSMDACEGDDTSAGYEIETCPAFNPGDASSVYPDPGCPGLEGAGVLPSISRTVVWAAVLFLLGFFSL
ncbi:hypothetical protein TrVE_jg732 [Triparma verrucosa]|uniref:Uncharacterized protein n=1 Tax=Triparma verrucosa TaxID=1606542 RepID=A0A9W6ZFP8_9STRA|nr:hypothetical protein TrVE_jg732 [Triparma verrucosa]